MPTYAYACTMCDHAFDIRQSFSDEALSDCPECSGRLRKVYNSIGVTFKGSGFYRTDSRAGASGSSLPAKSAATAAKESSGSGASSASASSGSSGSASSGSSSSTPVTTAAAS